MRCFSLFVIAVLLSACDRADVGPIDVVIIGDPQGLVEGDAYVSSAGAHLRAATDEGLVALDPVGEIVPAVAERWIVTDDGLSYIFRLRDSRWANDEQITGEDVQQALEDNIQRLSGTSLGLDLAKIAEVRAMTGRVVEIRLYSPMPDFLRLVAQPEMGLVRERRGVGPMSVATGEGEAPLRLTAIPPEQRGLPMSENWAELHRDIFLSAVSAEDAVAGFATGDIDLVLSGTIVDLPLADTGPLSAGTVRLDAPLGLLGLVFQHEEGLLEQATVREALAMAIDRGTLMQPFNFSGWQSNSWIYPLALVGAYGPTDARWTGLEIEERRGIAQRRVAAWEASEGEAAQVSVYLPVGTGSDLLFGQIAQDFATIGVEALRAEDADDADLVLHDELARYYSPRWYLNQFNCLLDIGLCAPEADALVEQAVTVTDQAEKDRLYAEAQAILIARQAYIPLGQPVRWSLVRGGIAGFQENQWGMHALFPLARNTI